MYIDAVIEVLEGHAETDWLASRLLAHLRRANAYDVGGVQALCSHLRKHEKLESFYHTAMSCPETEKIADEILPFVWMEHEQTGALVVASATCVRIFVFFVKEGELTVTLGYQDSADRKWRDCSGSALPAEWQVFFFSIWTNLVATAYLSSNPKHKIVTFQAPRPERRNKRGTKVLKPARKLVRTVIIDGVERVVTHQGVSYRVHANGWHPRRHKVGEFVRHCASGKTVKVRAHERGDESLGYVPWYDATNSDAQPRPTIRYKVQPDQSFYGDDLALEAGA